MSQQAFHRKVVIESGKPGSQGRRIENLRVSFSCGKTKSKEPNKAELQIYNLSPDSIPFFSTKGYITRISAGYGEIPYLLFVGDVHRAETAYRGTDSITQVQLRDGGIAYSSSRAAMTYKKDMLGRDIIRSLAKQAGLGVDVSQIGSLQDKRYKGFAASGPWRESVQNLADSMGMDFSIQDGKLELTTKDKPRSKQAFYLHKDNGLIGSPQKTKQGTKLRSLLNPAIRTRSLLQVESRSVSGWFVVRTLQHTGDSGFDNSFYTDILAQTLKT